MFNLSGLNWILRWISSRSRLTISGRTWLKWALDQYPTVNAVKLMAVMEPVAINRQGLLDPLRLHLILCTLAMVEEAIAIVIQITTVLLVPLVVLETRAWMVLLEFPVSMASLGNEQTTSTMSHQKAASTAQLDLKELQDQLEGQESEECEDRKDLPVSQDVTATLVCQASKVQLELLVRMASPDSQEKREQTQRSQSDLREHVDRQVQEERKAQLETKAKLDHKERLDQQAHQDHQDSKEQLAVMELKVLKELLERQEVMLNTVLVQEETAAEDRLEAPEVSLEDLEVTPMLTEEASQVLAIAVAFAFNKHLNGLFV